MLEIKVQGKSIATINTAVFVRGTVGEKVAISCDEEWGNRLKTVVFKRLDSCAEPIVHYIGAVSKTDIDIPHEILHESGQFYIGLYSVMGSETTPTLWSEVFNIEYGTDTDGVAPQPPTPTEYSQLIQLAEETKEIANSVREDADNGVFNGKDGQNGKDGKDGQDYVLTEADKKEIATLVSVDTEMQYKGKLPKGAEILNGYYNGNGAFVSSTTITTIKVPVVDNQVLFIQSMQRNSMNGISKNVQMRALGEDLTVKTIASLYGDLFAKLIANNGDKTHIGFLMYIMPNWGAKYIIFTILAQYVEDCIILDKTNASAFDNTLFAESGLPLYPKTLNNNKLVGKGYLSPSDKTYQSTNTIETYGVYKFPADIVLNLTYGSGTGMFGMAIDTDFVFIENIMPNTHPKQYQTTKECYLLVVDQCYGGEVHASFEIVNNKLEKTIPLSAIEDGGIVSFSQLNGKKWVSLGDSITYQEKWQPYVADLFGLVHTNCGIGSTYLAGNNSSAFWQDSRLNTVKNADPDFVTILGGANDLTVPIPIGTETEFTKALADKDKNTFIGAYSYIVENLLTWKPKLQIIILGTTWAHNDGLALNKGMTYTEYSDACKLVAEYYGLPFVDLHRNLGFNKFTMGASPYNIYSSDNIHPNEAGGKKIASMVIAKIKEIYSI